MKSDRLNENEMLADTFTSTVWICRADVVTMAMSGLTGALRSLKLSSQVTLHLQTLSGVLNHKNPIPKPPKLL